LAFERYVGGETYLRLPAGSRGRSGWRPRAKAEPF